MISENASIPIRTTTRSKPEDNFREPKVSLGIVYMESRPTQPAIKPNIPPRRPLMIDLPAADAIRVSENTISTAYSAGPNFKANAAIGSAMRIRITELNRQPKQDA